MRWSSPALRWKSERQSQTGLPTVALGCDGLPKGTRPAMKTGGSTVGRSGGRLARHVKAQTRVSGEEQEGWLRLARIDLRTRETAVRIRSIRIDQFGNATPGTRSQTPEIGQPAPGSGPGPVNPARPVLPSRQWRRHSHSDQTSGVATTVAC